MRPINQILTHLKWFLGYDVVGVLLDSKNVYLYDYYTGKELRLALTVITKPSRPYHLQIAQTVRFAQRRFGRWRKLVVLLSIQHPFFVDDLTKALSSIPNQGRNLYFFDIRMCLAIGAKLEPESEVKRLCVFLYEESAFIVTLFAGGFFQEMVVPLSNEVPLTPVLVPLILQMVQAVPPILPSRFEGKRFSPAEQRLLKDGWSRPFDGVIHIFPVHPHPFEVDELLVGHHVVRHDDIDTCREQGLRKIVDELATNAIYLKLLSYAATRRAE